MGATTVVQDRGGAGRHKAWALGGDLNFKSFTVTMPASYDTNGSACDFSPSFQTEIQGIAIANPSGYSFEYDKTNKKMKAYRTGAHTHAVALDTGASAAGSAHTHAFTGTAQAPVLKVEEVQAVAGNNCTLSHIPLYIAAVEVTAGSVTGAFNVIPAGQVPITKQVAVTFNIGVLAFLGTDAVTSVRVTYIPKRGSGYLSAVVVDEEVVASASKVNLAARAGLVQYVYDSTAGTLLSPEPPGEEPTAAANVVVDINDSGNTSIDTHADINGNTLKVTYVAFTQLAPGTFVDDTDITLSSQVWNFTGDPTVLGYHNLVVPALGTQLVGEATATNQLAAWVGPSGTAANAVAKWDPARNTITTAMTTPMTTTAISWMVLDPLQLTPATPAGTNANESTHTHGPGTLADAASAASTAAALAEVSNGVDLSAVVVDVLCWGR